MATDKHCKGMWIPRAILHDKQLSALDKMILTEITNLDQGDRGCFASNQHFANQFNCSIRTVTGSISRLIKLGYLHAEHFDGRKRQLHSMLGKFEIGSQHAERICVKSAKQQGGNCEADTQKIQSCSAETAKQLSKTDEAAEQTLQDNNTYNDTTNKTTSNKEYTTNTPPAPTLDEIEAYCKLRGNHINFKQFYDYYSASGWVDSKGNPVLNWEQKIILWEQYERGNTSNGFVASNLEEAKYGNYI